MWDSFILFFYNTTFSFFFKFKIVFQQSSAITYFLLRTIYLISSYSKLNMAVLGK